MREQFRLLDVDFAVGTGVTAHVHEKSVGSMSLDMGFDVKEFRELGVAGAEEKNTYLRHVIMF